MARIACSLVPLARQQTISCHLRMKRDRDTDLVHHHLGITLATTCPCANQLQLVGAVLPVTP